MTPPATLRPRRPDTARTHGVAGGQPQVAVLTVTGVRS
jgi:hypothetical protein